MRQTRSLRCLLVCVVTGCLGAAARADQFDNYTNPLIAKAVEQGKHVKEVKELTFDLLMMHGGVVPETNAALVIVVTNDRRYSKLLLSPARQRVGDKQFPMLLLEKYVTFKEATDRTVQASGQNVHLYAGTRFQLDLGQVVPEAMTGDLLIVPGATDPLTVAARPLDKARIFIATEPFPGVNPKKSDKRVIGDQFEMRYFNGKYKLRDDGRRSGSLTLRVNESGEVTGSFYSDRDGRKYDVEGKVGNPQHSISFTIKFPQAREEFNGFLFTGDGSAIAGIAKLQEREAGFYAERQEE